MLRAAAVFCTTTPDHRIRTYPELKRVEAYCAEAAGMLAAYDPDVLAFVSGPPEWPCTQTPAQVTATQIYREQADDCSDAGDVSVILQSGAGIHRQLDEVIRHLQRADGINAVSELLLICERRYRIRTYLLAKTKVDPAAITVTVAALGPGRLVLPGIVKRPFRALGAA